MIRPLHALLITGLLITGLLITSACDPSSIKPGDSKTAFILGKLLYEEKTENRRLGRAYSYFEIAAEKNQAESYYYLGLMNQNGEGVRRSEKNAIRYFKIGALSRDSKSQYMLAQYEKEGDIHNEQSLRWMQESAKNGNPEAQYEMGLIYFYGNGVPENRSEAIKWLKKSEKAGNEIAKSFLANNI